MPITSSPDGPLTDGRPLWECRKESANGRTGSKPETRDRPSSEPSLDAPAAPGYPKAMAKEIPSVGDLRRRSKIADAEIESTTDACPKNEGALLILLS